MFKNKNRQNQNRTRQRPSSSNNDRQPIHSLPSRSNHLSYSESRSARQNDNQRRTPTRDDRPTPGPDRLKRAPMLVLTLVILVFVIYQLSLSRQPKIIILPASNQTSAYYLKSNASYQEAAAEIMSGTSGSLTKITINPTALAAKMQSRFPGLKNVSVVLPVLGRQPIFYLQPAAAALILKTQNASNYLIATSGQVLSKSNDSSSFANLGLPIVNDQIVTLPSVNNQALSGSDVAFIQLVKSQFAAAHIGVSSMVLPAASRELDVYPSGVKYFVKFNLQDSQDAKVQVGTYLAARSYLSSQNITPGQYIDARLPGRVYYK